MNDHAAIEVPTQRTVRLVTFLGTGRYEKTKYRWSGRLDRAGASSVPSDVVSTKFVARAIAEFCGATEVVVLATEKAWETHGEEFRASLQTFGLRVPERAEDFFPNGATRDELWRQFGMLKDALRLPGGGLVLLDVTHGFRSSPFFAAAAAAFTRMVDPAPPELQVAYGAFEAKDAEGVAPIWDVTPFVELLDWSRDLMLFLRTGRAAEVAGSVKAIGQALHRACYEGGRDKPNLKPLAKAMKRLGEDVETVRTGSLLLGGSSSVAAFLSKLEEAKGDLSRHIPPLDDLFDRIRSVFKPLQTDHRLSEPGGLDAIQALASLYFKMGRYAEAAATLREGWINQHACERSDCPGRPEFDDEHRKSAEEAWKAADEYLAREIAGVRNDIQHAGYRRSPMRAATIKRKIDELISKFNP
jgi:CRISPR-associated protein Csx16